MDAEISQPQRKIDPASLANLRPFKPGQSGNPGGKVRHPPMTRRLRRALRLPAGTAIEARTIADELIAEWIGAAKRRDMAALREILNRVDGKVPDEVKTDGTLRIDVVYADFDRDPDPAAPGPA